MTAAAYNEVSHKQWQKPKTMADNSRRQQPTMTMAAAYDNSLRQQRPTLTTVGPTMTKVTMAYNDGRWRQQPTTVVAVPYIDGRQRQWPTRDKGAHRGIINKGRPRWHHKGHNDIYSRVEISGARWGVFFGYSPPPPCDDFLRFWSAINFGAPIAHLLRVR